MSNDKELNDAAVAWGICEEGEKLNAAKLNWFMDSRKGNDSIKAEGIREAVEQYCIGVNKDLDVLWSASKGDDAARIVKEKASLQRLKAEFYLYADKLEGKQ